MLLRRALWRLGLRYRNHGPDLPGRPDIIFRRAMVAVFCDGDFWHGKDWDQRRERLSRGRNPGYWTKKIETNLARDARVSSDLAEMGWLVIRVWESDIKADAGLAASRIAGAVRARSREKRLKPRVRSG